MGDKTFVRWKERGAFDCCLLSGIVLIKHENDLVSLKAKLQVVLKILVGTGSPTKDGDHWPLGPGFPDGKRIHLAFADDESFLLTSKEVLAEQPFLSVLANPAEVLFLITLFVADHLAGLSGVREAKSWPFSHTHIELFAGVERDLARSNRPMLSCVGKARVGGYAGIISGCQFFAGVTE